MTELCTQAYVAGEWLSSDTTFPIVNPASREEVAHVTDCDVDDARRAADAAVDAFASWSAATAYERAELLDRWQRLILEHDDELAEIMALEVGKPLAEGRAEAAYAAGFVKWYAGEAVRVYGRSVPSQDADKRILVSHRPVGVCYAVTPWNFPAAMITRKAAPALAAGCTMVVKPAEQTPLTALRLTQLWEEAGGPASTLQMVTASDPGPVSEVMMTDDRVRKVSFTGSTAVGKMLYEQSAPTMKRISMELGGHAPFIVHDDADIDAAVAELMTSKFRNAGQTCICANRVYVQRPIDEAFTDALVAAVDALTVGDPMDEATDIGPLVDEDGLAKVTDHVNDAVDKGAKVRLGGEPGDGLYFQPTVLTGLSKGMKVLEEETFGPVVPVVTFDTDDEAIALANDTPYGLAAYVWTRDLGRAFAALERLEYGIVGVNDGGPSTPQAPFGGVKQSGIGREGGPWGIEEYLDVRFGSIRLP